MLTGLSIRDIVLIDRLDLEFTGGLSVLTGETGAGKSILLDALGLALGDRSESRLLRHGSTRGSVTASFQMPRGHPATRLLAEQDIECDDVLLLRRVLMDGGRTRAFVNNEAVSVNLLRQLGDMLVEIQGQFAERGLMNRETQRAMLDAFGNLVAERAATRAAFGAWRDKRRAREQAEADSRRARQDEEYLRHALGELDTLEPAVGEEARLAEDRNMLMNAEALLNALAAGHAELEGDSGAENSLRGALAILDKVADKAAHRLDPPRAALERAIAETQEATQALREAADGLAPDEHGLEEIELRLFTLREVARKHRTGVDELPALREKLAQALASIDDQSDALERLSEEETAARTHYVERARALHEARKRAAARLDTAVNGELPPLKLEKAYFIASVEMSDEADWGADGMDLVEFRVSTIPGTPPGPISKIASGGELSRFMLALRVVLAEVQDVPTLIFDEVDSGVGGATADAVGQRLSRLARRVQVLVVTHSPQVAARGSAHLRVEKHDTDSSAVTGVDPLGPSERREEIARMLAGRDITDEARAAAGRLLEGERL